MGTDGSNSVTPTSITGVVGRTGDSHKGVVGRTGDSHKSYKWRYTRTYHKSGMLAIVAAIVAVWQTKTGELSERTEQDDSTREQ
jgi:hypothetical protein